MDGQNHDDDRIANGRYNEAYDPDDEICSNHDPESGKAENPEAEEEEAIIFTQVEKIEPRDFVSEIRPQMDIRHYFDLIQVLLDTDACDQNQVVKQLIQKVSVFLSIHLVAQDISLVTIFSFFHRRSIHKCSILLKRSFTLILEKLFFLR